MTKDKHRKVDLTESFKSLSRNGHYKRLRKTFIKDFIDNTKDISVDIGDMDPWKDMNFSTPAIELGVRRMTAQALEYIFSTIDAYHDVKKEEDDDYTNDYE